MERQVSCNLAIKYKMGEIKCFTFHLKMKKNKSLCNTVLVVSRNQLLYNELKFQDALLVLDFTKF